MHLGILRTVKLCAAARKVSRGAITNSSQCFHSVITAESGGYRHCREKKLHKDFNQHSHTCWLITGARVVMAL